MELDELKSYLEESTNRADKRAREALLEISEGKSKESEYMYESGYKAALEMVIRWIGR